MSAVRSAADPATGAEITVCLLADTHGHVDPRVLAIANTCDCVVHAGDIGGAQVLSGLAPRTGMVIAVRGNNDVPCKWPEDQRSRLETLPEQAILELPGGILAIEHGHRLRNTRDAHRLLRARHSARRAVVFGHTHRRVVDTDGEPWVLNPGAAGRARTFDGPGCLVLHAARDGWRIACHRFPPAPARRRGSRPA